MAMSTVNKKEANPAALSAPLAAKGRNVAPKPKAKPVQSSRRLGLNGSRHGRVKNASSQSSALRPASAAKKMRHAWPSATRPHINGPAATPPKKAMSMKAAVKGVRVGGNCRTVSGRAVTSCKPVAKPAATRPMP